jgi:hypothetical protein
MNSNDVTSGSDLGRRSLLKKTAIAGALGCTAAGASRPVAADHRRTLYLHGYEGTTRYEFTFLSQDYSTFKTEDRDNVEENDDGTTTISGYVAAGGEDRYSFDGTILDLSVSVSSGDTARSTWDFRDDFDSTGFDRLKITGSSRDTGEYRVRIANRGSIEKYAYCESCGSRGGDCQYYEDEVEGLIYDDVDIYSKDGEMLRSLGLEPHRDQEITIDHYSS